MLKYNVSNIMFPAPTNCQDASTCQNGGTCPNPGTAPCSCTGGYTGDTCATAPSK